MGRAGGWKRGCPPSPLRGGWPGAGSDGSGGGCAALSGGVADPSPSASLRTLPARGRDEAASPLQQRHRPGDEERNGRLARHLSSTKRFGIVGTSQTSMRLIV